MEGKKIEIVLCPYCHRENTIPEGAGVAVICSFCGKTWFTEGLEVSNKEAAKYYRELNEQDKRDFESRRDEN